MSFGPFGPFRCKVWVWTSMDRPFQINISRINRKHIDLSSHSVLSGTPFIFLIDFSKIIYIMTQCLNTQCFRTINNFYLIVFELALSAAYLSLYQLFWKSLRKMNGENSSDQNKPNQSRHTVTIQLQYCSTWQNRIHRTGTSLCRLERRAMPRVFAAVVIVICIDQPLPDTLLFHRCEGIVSIITTVPLK